MKTIHIKGIAKNIHLKTSIEHDCRFVFLFSSSDFPFNESGKSLKKNVFFRFYSSDKPCSLEEAMKGFMKKLFGNLEAIGGCFGYSEYTIEGFSLDSIKLGGHDLEKIIESQGDKYLHILIDIV
jgi:hypothetical protein